MIEGIDLKSSYIILHLFGVTVGAGGAFMSDLIFLSSIKDQNISPTEQRFMDIGSKMVWVGLVILVLSGILLMSLDVAGYLASSKFQAKMTIVGIIILNGIVFHFLHIPRIKRHVGEDLSSSDEFHRKAFLLFVSGVVSVISWIFALVLGSLQSIPISYLPTMMVYGIVVVSGVLLGWILLKGVLFSSHRRKK